MMKKMSMHSLDADTCLLPPGADRERLVVCAGDRWAVALKRELPEALDIRRAADLAECRRALDEAPASFAVVELTAANADSLLQWLPRPARELPLCRVAVVANRELARFEWLLREAGAVHFACNTRNLAALARAICRHLHRAPVHRQSLQDRVWARLPWADDTIPHE